MEQLIPSRKIIGPSFQLLSNWCSMGCAGCGIHVAAPSGSEIVNLEANHLANARANLQMVKEKLDDMGFEYAMVEQSGGEPTHHPQVVATVGEVFENAVHKIITNGLTSRSIYPYLRERSDRVFVVVSIDHQEIEQNYIRLGSAQKSKPHRAAEMHSMILGNLDLFVTSGIAVVVSTIISRWNIDRYLDFIGWLEAKYPNQIQDGKLTPIPVSLVSFGNANLGKLNPTNEQINEFEEAVDRSRLLTVGRTRDWLFKQLLGHYRNKERFFERGESLEQIQSSPSRLSCEIFRHMISFNFQDEEILRPPDQALFEGYSCGVKVLGNIGHELGAASHRRLETFGDRPSNMKAGKKYYRTNQVEEYINRKERVTHDGEAIEMGGEVGYFGNLRRGMCMLDDFDGVWWPFNVYLQHAVDEAQLGEYWSLFRNGRFMEKLRQVREAANVTETAGRHHAGGLPEYGKALRWERARV